MPTHRVERSWYVQAQAKSERNSVTQEGDSAAMLSFDQGNCKKRGIILCRCCISRLRNHSSVAQATCQQPLRIRQNISSGAWVLTPHAHHPARSRSNTRLQKLAAWSSHTASASSRHSSMAAVSQASRSSQLLPAAAAGLRLLMRCATT